MITLNNVSFSYGEKAVLENFSLDIDKSDKICLFGESGCGKTTVTRLILGLLKPDSGEVVKDKQLKPSVVFQENLLLPFKSVLKNITLLGADNKTAEANLEALGIADYKNSLPSSLSGGIERRVAIARALSQDFDFLILDEPFTGLDKENILKAAALILKIAQNKPIILITHSMLEAELLGCKIINMQKIS